MSVPIRHATDDDGPALSALIAGVFAEYEGCLFDPAEFDFVTPATAFTGGGGAIWVAEGEARIVGTIGVAPTSEAGVAQIHQLYVAADHRRRGLAPRLVDLALAHAAAGGAGAVRLWSDTRFLDAHRFYERHGFQRLPAVRYLADLSSSWEFGFCRRLGEPVP